MKTDRRAQVYLDEAAYQRAVRYARRRGESFASIVREALDRFLDSADTVQPQFQPAGVADPLAKLAGLWDGKGSPGDLSERHDAYLVDDEVGRYAGPARRRRR